MSAKLTDITVLIEIIKNALHTQSIFCIRPKVEIISLIILNALFTRVFNGFVSYKWHTHKTLDFKS